MQHAGIILHTQLLLPLKHIYYNHIQIQKKSYPQKKKTLISTTFPPKQAKAQSSSTPVSMQLISTMKQSTLDEHPKLDKGNFTTKNKYILSNVQQANNEILVERTKLKKRQLKKFQGTQQQESLKSQFEQWSPSENNRTGKKHF